MYTRGVAPRLSNADTVRNDRKKSLFISVCSFAVSLGLLTLFWARYVRPEYFPISDDISLIVGSTKFFRPSVSSWFLSGYSQYFNTYPEWFVPYTNFLRPVANAAYYANSLVFGSCWSCYLLLTYAVQSGIVASATYIAYRKVELSLVEALCIGTLCFFSPAFIPQSMFMSSYALDLMAALFVLLGINELLSRRLLLAWMLFTLAIFTKETALFAPPVAAYMVFRDSFGQPEPRRILKSAGFLAPVLAWWLLRLYAFRASGGVYVVKSSAMDRLMSVVTGMLSWPTGLVSFHWTPGKSLSLGEPTNYVLALLNVCFWGAVITALILALQARRLSKLNVPAANIAEQYGLGSRNRMVICWFGLGSLAMPVIFDLPIRFAAALFPLIAILSMCVLRSAQWKTLRIGALMMLSITSAASLRQKATAIPTALPAFRYLWIMSKNYIDQISRSQASTLFLANDASGAFASPAMVGRFAHYQGRLVRINDLNISLAGISGECEGQPNVNLWQVSPGNFTIFSDLSGACGAYVLNGAGKLSSSVRQREFARNTSAGELRYRMPSPLRLSDQKALMECGSGLMQVEVSGASPDSEVLIPDIGSRQYRIVRPSSAQ